MPVIEGGEFLEVFDQAPGLVFVRLGLKPGTEGLYGRLECKVRPAQVCERRRLGAAMFEAIHGSAPRRAGQNLANPSGLFLGSIMMLVHIGQTEVAERAHNAWLKTMEDGIHTYDIFREGVSKQKVGTKEFAEAVVSRLGQTPAKLPVARYNAAPPQSASSKELTDRKSVV